MNILAVYVWLKAEVCIRNESFLMSLEARVDNQIDGMNLIDIKCWSFHFKQHYDYLSTAINEARSFRY